MNEHQAGYIFEGLSTQVQANKIYEYLLDTFNTGKFGISGFIDYLRYRPSNDEFSIYIDRDGIEPIIISYPTIEDRQKTPMQSLYDLAQELSTDGQVRVHELSSTELRVVLEDIT
jgi:hypothetical protein